MTPLTSAIRLALCAEARSAWPEARAAWRLGWALAEQARDEAFASYCFQAYLACARDLPAPASAPPRRRPGRWTAGVSAIGEWIWWGERLAPLDEDGAGVGPWRWRGLRVWWRRGISWIWIF